MERDIHMTGPLTALRRSTVLPVVVLLAVLGLSGCGGATAAKHTADGKTVLRYQSSAGSVDVLELASALGDLPDIKLQKVGDVTGGPQMLQALVSHQVDIASSPFFGATAQLVATGAPIKAVVSTYGSSGDIYSALVTMAGSPIKTARDLLGKKVAVNTLGANSEAILDTWFAKQGLSHDQIKQITLVALPPLNTEEALRHNQIDAAVLSVGQLTVAQRRGGIATVFKDTDVVGPYNGGGAVLADEFLNQDPTAATEVATGIAKAVRYIDDHGRRQVLDVFDKWLRDNGFGDYVEAVDANWPGNTGVPSPQAQIRDQDVALWLNWLGSRGDVDPSKIKPGDVFTNQYNKEAAG